MRISIEQATVLLLNSAVVAIPTETVYGLAAIASDERGVEKIFELKKRPKINPLITHLASKNDLSMYVSSIHKEVEVLVQTFWPGPLTLVLPILSGTLPALVTAGKPTAAFRVPALSTTRELIRRTSPLVAPSANISGRPSATCRAHVERDFGFNFPVFEDKSCKFDSTEYGLESTILVYTQESFVVGRLGAIPVRTLEKALNQKLPLAISSTAPVCPGQLLRHYAPDAEILLAIDPWHATLQEQFDCVVGFSDRMYEGASLLLPWGRSDDPIGCGKELYSTLRRLDEIGSKRVFWDGYGLDIQEWQAIQDRLIKASSR